MNLSLVLFPSIKKNFVGKLRSSKKYLLCFFKKWNFFRMVWWWVKWKRKASYKRACRLHAAHKQRTVNSFSVNLRRAKDTQSMERTPGTSSSLCVHAKNRQILVVVNGMWIVHRQCGTGSQSHPHIHAFGSQTIPPACVCKALWLPSCLLGALYRK